MFESGQYYEEHLCFDLIWDVNNGRVKRGRSRDDIKPRRCIFRYYIGDTVIYAVNI